MTGRAIEARRRSAAPGATVLPDGVNFSVYSRDAVRIDLLLFEGAGDEVPSRVIALDPVANRTYHYWHIFVPGVRAAPRTVVVLIAP